MKRLLIVPFILLAMVMLFSLGCEPDDPTDPVDPVDPVEPVDPDDQVEPAPPGDYESVTIGNQVWMKKNLNHSTGNSWCYDNDPANCDIYGRLYDHTTAMSVCPSGWHLPSEDEWTILIDFLGGESVAGGKMKSTGTIEAGTGLWYDPNEGATNESEFSGLPGGSYNPNGDFESMGSNGRWWSSTGGPYQSKALYLTWGKSFTFWSGPNNSNGLSVRCIKD